MRETGGPGGLERKIPFWVVVFVTMAACMLAGNQFTPLLNMYKTVLGISEVDVSLLFGAYVAGLAPSLVLSPRLADRFGRRPLLAAATISGLAASLVLLAGAYVPGLLFVGRVLGGLSVGTASVVGSTWLMELSSTPFVSAPGPGDGPRRASLAVTSGSLIGALVAGLVAQFTVLGQILPYVIHAALTVVTLFLLPLVPETREARVEPAPGKLLPPRAPAHRRPRWVMTVVSAPWLFISAGLVYAYLPVALQDRTGHLGVVYATALSTITLAVGAFAQAATKRRPRLRDTGIPTSMVVFGGGMLLMAAAVAAGSLLLGMLAAVVVGIGFGVGLVAGLTSVQQRPGRLGIAQRNGNFYAIAFCGFLAPSGVSALAQFFPLVSLLAVLGLVCFVIAGGLLCSRRKKRVAVT